MDQDLDRPFYFRCEYLEDHCLSARADHAARVVRILAVDLLPHTRRRPALGKYEPRLIDELHFHDAAPDRAAKLAVRRNGHFVSRASRAGSAARSHDKEHRVLAAFESLVDELPEFEFLPHKAILHGSVG